MVYISRLLAISDGTSRSAGDISDLTGIPQGASSGKVVPHLDYMALMGLLCEDRSTLTELGERVRMEDPACSELLTQWLLHANLTSVQGADMWNYVYRQLLPANSRRVSDAFYKSSVEAHFPTAKRYGCLRTFYEKQVPDLEYLSSEKGALIINTQPIRREFIFLYAYDIVREWEALYGDIPEITASQFEAMQCAAVFGIPDENWFSVLEMLAGKGLFRINRQLAPYTVIRCTDSCSLISKLYSLLV